MDSKVGIKIEIDHSCSDPQVIIKTDRESDLTKRIINSIERCIAGEYPPITVYNDDGVILLDQWEIKRIFTENRRIVVSTDGGFFESKLNLREFEEILDDSNFARISRFEIVNLRKIYAFDMSITGTIKVTFEDGSDTWVARRYVRTIQEKLSVKRGGDHR